MGKRLQLRLIELETDVELITKTGELRITMSNDLLQHNTKYKLKQNTNEEHRTENTWELKETTEQEHRRVKQRNNQTIEKTRHWKPKKPRSNYQQKGETNTNRINPNLNQ